MFSQNGFAGGYLRIMKYPRVKNEFETLNEMLSGKSISRFGDGEFRLCFGIKSISQMPSENLKKELIEIIKTGSTEKCLVGIPPIDDPQVTQGVKDFYKNPNRNHFIELPDPEKIYYSSYISRPNFKPSFWTDEFHAKVIDLWRDKDVILVASKHHGEGNSTSLRPARMPEAKSIEVIYGPWRDAYADIDKIMDNVLACNSSGCPVFLCLGAAATVLAWRLSQKGITAYDLGHIGQFVQRWRTDRKIYKGKK